MRYHKDFDSSNFERHEIKTYQRKGDQVRSEYERLNPDGTVTKTVAYGDCKEGLKYRTYHMGLDGVVREIPQDVVQRMMNLQQQPQVAPPPPPPAPPAPEKPARKAFAFMVEPKETQDGQSIWRVKPLHIKTKESAPAPPPSPPTPPPPPAQAKVLPWWYDTLKEAINESMKEDKARIPKPEPPPVPEPKKVSSKRIFDWLDDDFFALKPFKAAPKPKLFDNLLGDFDKPLLDVFNTPLLDDF
ncbi:uncharacterized protein LOC128986908 [Macrosteles quadrilineatus]|uniref:uncharacterized protein LOC128986908 n=1 Tax=Macrosteles quadrilineatus TaxID=74068 RepID=UPI0023E15AE3|nr:uncharacterized protein LOC128986908 [Macrosteles quadrilineatus]